ncbi:hypothetical protein GSS87_00730 [Corynebacterium sp. 4HC-13]|uniref:Uncharacterized protein n=2 Tax=Corynebacterium anserum TaxID=2684406 RepID=A0A7G7YQV3_9CORY|nr:hypothetical protein [Corynebacterium anserum]QNH96873.1 hypothetical protein GP473_01940 [Corynebacterium anserum]
MLLLGWVGSTYATWMLRDNDIQLLSPEAHHGCAAELRSLFCSLFPTSADLDDRTEDPTEELWRLRPALAWHTPQLAWESLLSEASDLGLLGPGGGAAGVVGSMVSSSDSVKSPAAPQATSALDALRETLREMEARIAGGEPMSHHEALYSLSMRLSTILPDPVRMLIIQSDHTILAPGLLSTEDQNQLSRMAEQESSGMASVWRVSKRTLLSAFASGDTVEQIEAFLDSMSPGGLASVPQSLRYLLSDTFRAYSHGGLAHSSYDGLPGSVPSRRGHSGLSHVPTPTRIPNDPSVEPAGDISLQIAGAVESFRRTHAGSESFDSTQGFPSTDTRTVRTPRDVMAELRMAYSSGRQVRLHYVDYAGAISQEWISIVMMTPSTISAVIDSTGETITIQPHRIAAVDVPR